MNFYLFAITLINFPILLFQSIRSQLLSTTNNYLSEANLLCMYYVLFLIFFSFLRKA